MTIAGVTLLLLLSSMRVKFNYSSDQLRLLVGLGKIGSEFDFRSGRGAITAFGHNLKQFPLKSSGEDKLSKAKSKAEKKKEPESKPKRIRPLSTMIAVANKSRQPLWSFLVNTLRAIAVEEAEGELTAGFDSPDYTGIAYGYYYALAGAVPAVGRRVEFVPDWSGASLAGEVRLSFALPVYKLAYRLAILLVGLPLRDLIKLAIGTKKGGQDGQ